MGDEVKPGISTSEHAVTKSGGTWGIVATVLGFLISTGSLVGASLGADTKWGIIAGALVSLAGIMQKTLTDLGYINSRTKIKQAASRE